MTAEPPQTLSRGKRWAYIGASVGATVSVLANVAHSFVPAQPVGMSDEAWRMLPSASPQQGAVLLAAFWPLALLLAIEVLARVEWPRQLRWTIVRWGGVSPVALVAAVVSYLHLSGLLHWYGEDPLTVTIGPAAVDGLMVVSTGALLALAARVVVPAHAITDPIGDLIGQPIADPITEPTAQPSALVESEPIGSVGSDASAIQPEEPLAGAVRADGSDRVVALHAVPDRVESSAPVGARPEDLDRAREAIRAGHLSYPLTADAIKDHLKIGLKNARLVRDALQDQQEEA